MTFLRYIAIQLLAYIIDLGVFLVALKVGLFGAIVSNIFSKIAAGCFAFVAHRNFTFDSNGSEDRFHQAVRYFLLLLLNIPVSSGILAIILIFIKEEVTAKILADIVGVALIFWLSKSFVFIKKQKDTTTPIASEDSN